MCRSARSTFTTSTVAPPSPCRRTATACGGGASGCHICAGTGPPLPRLRRDWAHPFLVCAGTAVVADTCAGDTTRTMTHAEMVGRMRCVPCTAWYPTRHGVPHGTVSRMARYPTRHGVPHGTVSRASRYPARHGITPGMASHPARYPARHGMVSHPARCPAQQSTVIRCCAQCADRFGRRLDVCAAAPAGSVSTL